MNRHQLEVLALTLGMAVTVTGVMAQTGSRSAPAPAVDVAVVDGAIQVSQTAVRTPSGTVTLTWQLRTEGYRFTSASIDFGDAQGYFSCATLNYGQMVRCTKSDQAPGGQLPYRIRLSDGQEMVSLPQPNVFIQND